MGSLEPSHQFVIIVIVPGERSAAAASSGSPMRAVGPGIRGPAPVRASRVVMPVPPLELPDEAVVVVVSGHRGLPMRPLRRALGPLLRLRRLLPDLLVDLVPA